MKPAKPYNGGTWTDARFHSFIVSQLRKGQWPQKYKAIQNAFVENGINPKTGRKCKFHRCAECKELFVAKEMRADHIVPVVDPAIGFVDWNEYIERMFPEVEGFQAICVDCHKVKTAEERAIRDARKRKLKEAEKQQTEPELDLS